MPSNMLCPPKRWWRRMDVLADRWPPLTPLTALGVDPGALARLTSAEQLEFSRLMSVVNRVGLAGLSKPELDRFLCFLVILDDDDTAETLA